MTPPHVCSDFRAQWASWSPEGAPGPDSRGVLGDEVAECEDCALWMRRRRQSIGLISTLPRLQAPARLTARVERELRWSAVERIPAPGVLDRLVEEEIERGGPAAPLRALGGLSRLEAPNSLDEMVRSQLLTPTTEAAPRRRGTILRSVRAWAPLAAAAALLMILVPVGNDAGQPQPRLQLRAAKSASDFGPLGSGILQGLRGVPDGALGRTEQER